MKSPACLGVLVGTLMLLPRAQAGAPVIEVPRHVPIWYFGILTKEKLTLGPGSVVSAFDSRYHPFRFTPELGNDWTDIASPRRAPGFNDARVASLGPIEIRGGRIWGDVYTSFERGPSPDLLDEQGYFTEDAWEESPPQDLTALSLSESGHISGNAEVTKGLVRLGDPGSAKPYHGIAGSLHAPFAYCEVDAHSEEQVGALVGEDELPATLTLEEGTQLAFSSALLAEMNREAQHLACRLNAGWFDATGHFNEGLFEIPPAVPASNEAIRLEFLEQLTEQVLKYNPDLHIGPVAEWKDAPTLYHGGKEAAPAGARGAIRSPNGDGTYPFSTLTMNHEQSRWRVDLANGDVTVYVSGDCLLDRGQFELANSEGNDHQFKLIVGGMRGGDLAKRESPEYSRRGELGQRMLDDSQCRIQITIHTQEANLTVQAASLQLKNGGALRTLGDLAIWSTSSLTLGEAGQSSGFLQAGGELFLAAGGPPRVEGVSQETYGNIVLNDASTIVSGGSASFELKPNRALQAGGGSLTGVLQLRGESRIEIGKDALVDAAALWLSGTAPTFFLPNGILWAVLQDAYSMDYCARLENLAQPVALFVNLGEDEDWEAPNLGQDTYRDDNASGSHSESMLLETNAMRLSHCTDFWGGMWGPATEAFVLHNISWFGAMAARDYTSVGHTEFYQDRRLLDYTTFGVSHDRLSESPAAPPDSSTNSDYVPDYSKIVLEEGNGVRRTDSGSVVEQLEQTITVETGASAPGGPTPFAEQPVAMTLREWGELFNDPKKPTWARAVPELYLTEWDERAKRFRVIPRQVQDLRYEWYCAVHNTNFRGNIDALFQHQSAGGENGDYMGEAGVEPLPFPLPIVPSSQSEFYRRKEVSWTIGTDVVVNNSVPGSDLEITFVASRSDEGGMVVLNGTQISYFPPPHDPFHDSFTYRLTDDRGRHATGRIHLVDERVRRAPVISGLVEAGAHKELRIVGHGQPGRTIDLQASSLENGGQWETVATGILGPDGTTTFQHSTEFPREFFRTVTR